MCSTDFTWLPDEHSVWLQLEKVSLFSLHMAALSKDQMGSEIKEDFWLVSE